MARLELITGKGGVGKTTLAAALALEAARQGRKPIVVELGHRASLSAIFDMPIGFAPVEVSSGVHATNIALAPALLDYLTRRIRVASIARRIAESKTLAPFFDAAPAVMEVLTLERLEALLSDYDPVLVDLDATGHAEMFLDVSSVLSSLADGVLGDVLKGLTALLSDRARTRLHIVTLPERLPLHEASELILRTQQNARVALGTVWVNRTTERPIGAHDNEALMRLQQRLPEPPEALLALSQALEAHDEAQRLIAALPVKVLHLPQFTAMSRDALSALGMLAYPGIAP